VAALVRELDIDSRKIMVRGVAKWAGSQDVTLVLGPGTTGPTKVVARQNVSLQLVSWSQAALDAVIDKINDEPEGIKHTLEAHSLVWAEGDYFRNAVGLHEHTLALLRDLERASGRMAQIATHYEKTKLLLEAFAKEAGTRLQEIDGEVAEARHDITAGRALLAEEKERVKAVNTRRLDILENRIPFFVYHRQRAVELATKMPEVTLAPGSIGAVLPEAFATTAEPPADLRELVELLRDAPLRWFSQAPVILRDLDRLELLRRALVAARARAGVSTERVFIPVGPAAARLL
jgi:hypothetical protein